MAYLSDRQNYNLSPHPHTETVPETVITELISARLLDHTKAWLAGTLRQTSENFNLDAKTDRNALDMRVLVTD